MARANGRRSQPSRTTCAPGRCTGIAHGRYVQPSPVSVGRRRCRDSTSTWSPPTSDLVRAATAWAEEVHEPWLLRHGLRTWLFGHLLGQLDGVDSDPEALYLTCLLHDVGLTAGHRVPQGAGADGCRCFAVHGAHVSEQKLLELGASPLLASEVADAIGMHLNAKVGIESGGAARLVNQGAALDVVGTRASDLGRQPDQPGDRASRPRWIRR